MGFISYESPKTGRGYRVCRMSDTLLIGDIPPMQHKAVWIRRIRPKWYARLYIWFKNKVRRFFTLKHKRVFQPEWKFTIKISTDENGVL